MLFSCKTLSSNSQTLQLTVRVTLRGRFELQCLLDPGHCGAQARDEVRFAAFCLLGLWQCGGCIITW